MPDAIPVHSGPKSLPLFAPYPPQLVQEQLNPSQWDEYLAASVSVAEQYLQLSSEVFQKANDDHTGLVRFLQSYYDVTFGSQKRETPLTPNAVRLRQHCFLLVHRCFTVYSERVSFLLGWRFLGHFSHAHLKARSLVELLQSVWTKHESVLRKSLGEVKTAVTSISESKDPGPATIDLRILAPLFHSLPQAAACMTEGSEFIDALSSAYNKGAPPSDALVPVAYLSLVSLTRPEAANRSALIDHLYSLKSLADADKTRPSLLADLVTNTPLLSKLAGAPGEKGGERARTLAASLRAFETPSIARQRRSRPACVDKGKAPAGPGATADHHVHLLSKIIQIQDLFPDLGSGFISRLLDAYNEDVELVTSHLLEDSLPPALASLDRTLQLPSDHPPDPSSQSAIDTLIPSSRRNVFDNDDFDRLAISPAQLHVGHRNTTPSTLSAPQNKASILAALAAFDSDSDERDDTYDAADVGGTVDITSSTGDDSAADPLAAHEAQLWPLFTSQPDLLTRTARRTQPREQLKRDTGLTDEALEGWAAMLTRDPRRQKQLAERFADAPARTIGLQRTAWRAGEDDDADSEGGTRTPRGGFRGRGRGRGRGDVAGRPQEAGTAAARQRKETNKARGANHSRREGRARKVARAGFPG